MLRFCIRATKYIVIKIERILNCRDLSRLIRNELKEPLIWLDIGARFGSNQIQRILAKKKHLCIFGFEPDQDECDLLNSTQKESTYLPYAIGDKNEKKEFHVTRHPGASSFLKPNESVLQPYPIKRCFEVVKKVRMEMVTLDQLVEEKKIPIPHIIKTDTQGFELQVLKGAEKTLEHVYGIQLEAHLEPLYEKQSLFWEIKDYLETKGFDLAGIHSEGPFEGKVLELECCFFKNSSSYKNKVIKHLFEKISGEELIPSMADVIDIPGWKSFGNYINPDDLKHSKILKSYS